MLGHFLNITEHWFDHMQNDENIYTPDYYTPD